jgi:hypothetical protein
MNGEAFLADYSSNRREILIQVLEGKMPYVQREKIFLQLAAKNKFTVKQLGILARLTGLTTDAIINYDRGSSFKNKRGVYKGIMYEFDDRTFEVTFRQVNWTVIDIAKVSEVISIKELDKLIKKKIDDRSIF